MPYADQAAFELAEIHLLESKACTTITQPSPCLALWPIDVTRSEMVNFSFSHEMEPYRPIPHTWFPHSLRKNSYGRTLADYLKPEGRELVKVNLWVSPYSRRWGATGSGSSRIWVLPISHKVPTVAEVRGTGNPLLVISPVSSEKQSPQLEASTFSCWPQSLITIPLSGWPL